MIKVLVADDHQMFIDGIKSMLETSENIEVVAEAMNGKQVLEICEKREVDLVIMDISMPELDGLETSKQLLKLYPDIKILGLSMHNDRNFISDMLKTGAHGYILKNTGKQNLIEAIEAIHGGETFLGEQVQQTLLNSFMKKSKSLQVEKLSSREQEVLESIATGMTTQEIAEQLFISKNTVETHRKNLLFKLKAKNTAELVNNAYKERLIQ
ncbi:response regulator transcription factor [Litoribacter ruber]|uniref:Response regulator transcription factor n=1 Tax=Litoribacter ruber TaxID=702568 RepID=A0AAP2CIL4_9BACT|nr:MULTISPECIES: response regulator transcription factor [Litoribacter]MBS9525418.1 response regulator transcription factor [Litoribacter alkaliphilus]MBT0810505.1 response regulator transcription factor [Litoribacter ruber]